MVLNQEFIKSVVPEVLFVGAVLPPDCSWGVDSRTVQRNDIFVALQGMHVDGHNFIEQAIAAGARGCMIAQHMQQALAHVIAKYQKTHTFIIVPSPQETLYTLAAAWRKNFSYPVVGITGSVGKTTTKEIVCNILRHHNVKFLASRGNQNTLIGVPLNILNMRADHEVAIFEMGINKRGEMAALAKLVQPTIAMITSIGHSHMEGLGSIIDIATEKRDIFKYLKDDGIGVINGDQALLASISYTHPIVKFGRKMVNQVQARKIQIGIGCTHFQLKLYHERYAITLPTENSTRIYNSLAAATIAYLLKVPALKICAGIQEPLVVDGRFKKYAITGTESTLIDDSYNASPESMKAALLAFETIESSGRKKIAVLADMLELGINAPFWHRQLGRFLRKVPSLDHVIFIGEQVKWAQKMVPIGLRYTMVPSWQEAVTILQPQVKQDKSLILVKGSLGMGLKNLVTAFTV